MMVLTQTIISKHFIKPSIPPPDRFKILEFSFLDQLVPHEYMCPIFFYKNDESKSNIEISQLLKQSLSQVLAVFHPFSGIIKENSFVDYNETGVSVVEAQIHTRLAQVIEEPQMEGLNQLVHEDNSNHNNNAILLVKVNFFDCGGIAINICLSHKVADYSSVMVFMNAWASMCRGETQIIQPLFNLAVHFPPKDITLSNYSPNNEIDKRIKFVFDNEKLERLQQQMSSTKVKDPTKVEALTVFFSQQFIQAIKAISGQNKTSFIIHHAINLRPRAIPPIPGQTIGNCVSTFNAVISDTMDSSELISELRVAKNSVDNNFIKEVINTEEYIRRMDKLIELYKSGTKFLMFTSLWRFPMYDIDFGWGKPIWVSDSTTSLKNTIMLMGTPSKDGIEALVNLSDDDLLQMIEINVNNFLKSS